MISTLVEPSPCSPDDLARALALIQQQLAGLSTRENYDEMASDLARIRDDLRRLAADNDDVRKIIEPLLWDEPPG